MYWNLKVPKMIKFVKFHIHCTKWEQLRYCYKQKSKSFASLSEIASRKQVLNEGD